MTKLKKKFLIFDLDGVLIDSKKNMSLSWKKVQDKHLLHNINFNQYFKHIGRPFNDILRLIGVKKEFNKINKTYQIESIKNKNKIKFFKNTTLVLKKLKQKKYSLNILTSKDKKRTMKFLGKNVNLFNHIECDTIYTKGKPHPDKMNKIIMKSKYKKSDCVYIGDTQVDYLTAKNAKIDFIFAKWGYGKNYNYKYKCKEIKSLLKILHNQ